MIKFNCPHCQKEIQAADEHAGRKDQCEHCMGLYVVPSVVKVPDASESAGEFELSGEVSNVTAPVASIVTPAAASLPAKPSISQEPALTSDQSPAEQKLVGAYGVRDRIVILGRRAAGKTVYLATLYSKCWRSLKDLTMSALGGQTHLELMEVMAGLAKGQWPPATLENSRIAIEINYRRRKRLLVSMDYSGELFRRAFVEENAESPEVKELLAHLDNAGAVIILADPSKTPHHATDFDAAVDNDFGLVQAVKRIRDWPGGENIPISVVLTKIDQHFNLIKQKNGAVNFVRHHWPALARTLQSCPVFMVSAVQSWKTGDKIVPKPDSKAINVDAPLLYCLNQMEKRELHETFAKQKQAEAQASSRAVEAFEKSERQKHALAIMAIVGILLLGALTLILIYIRKNY